jgi:hypothetical protein
MDTYTDNLIIENSKKGKHKEFQEIYENLVNEKKNKSFIIIDRCAPIKYRYILCDGGMKCEFLSLS